MKAQDYADPEATSTACVEAVLYPTVQYINWWMMNLGQSLMIHHKTSYMTHTIILDVWWFTQNAMQNPPGIHPQLGFTSSLGLWTLGRPLPHVAGRLSHDGIPGNQCNSFLVKIAMEIASFPIENSGSVHSYVSTSIPFQGRWIGIFGNSSAATQCIPKMSQ